jgi:hypothetical protein
MVSKVRTLNLVKNIILLRLDLYDLSHAILCFASDRYFLFFLLSFQVREDTYLLIIVRCFLTAGLEDGLNNRYTAVEHNIQYSKHEQDIGRQDDTDTARRVPIFVICMYLDFLYLTYKICKAFILHINFSFLFMHMSDESSENKVSYHF